MLAIFTMMPLGGASRSDLASIDIGPWDGKIMNPLVAIIIGMAALLVIIVWGIVILVKAARPPMGLVPQRCLAS